MERTSKIQNPGGLQAAGVAHNDPREPTRAIWVVHGLKTHATIQREHPESEKKELKFGAGEEQKKERNFGRSGGRQSGVGRSREGKKHKVQQNR